MALIIDNILRTQFTQELCDAISDAIVVVGTPYSVHSSLIPLMNGLINI